MVIKKQQKMNYLLEIYKKTKDSKIMEIMKRLTTIKKKIEKRLKGKPLTA